MLKQLKFKKSVGGYRWRLCALLFFATTLNYLDRSVLSILAPTLQNNIGWSEMEYSYIVSAFELAYGISVVGMGKLVDKYGARIIFSIAISLWSLASIGHALVRSVVGFALARFTLGAGEAANFPAALATVTEWFPKKERATAAGIFNAGSSIGAIIAPLVVPWIALRYGWQMAFILTGLLGFIWLIFWQLTYRKPNNHPQLSKEELAYIQSDDKQGGTSRIAWRRVFVKKETIVICLVRFLSDPTWWFLLFWLPKFLNKDYGITLAGIGPPMITIYLLADVGSISGGWFSSYFIKKNKSVDFARKATMLVCALCVIPIIFVSQMSNFYVAVGLISLAAAAHMGFVANIYTIISDIFPQKAIGSVTGLSTMSAVFGGMFFSTAIGAILQATGSYFLIFLIAAFTYLTAWIVLMIGIPQIKSIKL